MKIAGKNILVVGLGSTGEAVTAFLIKRGARVTVTDAAGVDELGERAGRIQEMGADLEAGGHHQESFDGADLIVISPGVPHDIAPVRRAVEKGVRLIGEIELASRFISEPIIAVTGTNGKTTTTTLIGEMLKASEIRTFVGGNIGLPLIGYPDGTEKSNVIVAEISSFQLDTIETFRPSVAVLLNIAEDHLDRYPDLNGYAASKGRLFENQQAQDTAVINAGDELSCSVSDAILSRKLLFRFKSEATGEDPELSATITDKAVVFKKETAIGNAEDFALQRADYPLYGHHNWENAAAAGLAVLAAGGNQVGIRNALTRFKGLAHRLERIATVNGVTYFNDSKATNVAAVERALSGFDRPVVLILGGRNKDCDFNLLKQSLRKHVKQVVAIGEASREITDTLNATVPIKTAVSMKDAVICARECATKNDIVLLSPACTSFDMYNNYAERGDDFRTEVLELKS